jgi:hypothetical protein
MDFGIFLDFVLRPGGTPEAAFKESFDLVDLAEAMGLDTVGWARCTSTPIAPSSLHRSWLPVL